MMSISKTKITTQIQIVHSVERECNDKENIHHLFKKEKHQQEKSQPPDGRSQFHPSVFLAFGHTGKSFLSEFPKEKHKLRDQKIVVAI